MSSQTEGDSKSDEVSIKSPWYRQLRWPETQTWIFVLLLSIPVLTAVDFFWSLHTPNPRVKTSTVLTRMSLLPHRFAGVCMNCHRIQEIGPAQINRESMHVFRLNPIQKRLIEAGQQVMVPRFRHEIQIPGIFRADTLEHNFVGVCSNCHAILDVAPPDDYMQRMMRRGYQSLLFMGLPDEVIARGGRPEDPARANLRNVFGVFSFILFIFSSVYVVMRQLVRHNPKKYKRRFNIRNWFTIHEWTSIAFAGTASVHWYFSDQGNNFLHVALLMILWLTGAGLVLRRKLALGTLKKNVRLVHTQRYVYLTLVGLLIIGHWLAVTIHFGQ